MRGSCGVLAAAAGLAIFGGVGPGGSGGVARADSFSWSGFSSTSFFDACDDWSGHSDLSLSFSFSTHNRWDRDWDRHDARHGWWGGGYYSRPYFSSWHHPVYVHPQRFYVPRYYAPRPVYWYDPCPPVIIDTYRPVIIDPCDPWYAPSYHPYRPYRRYVSGFSFFYRERHDDSFFSFSFGSGGRHHDRYSGHHGHHTHVAPVIIAPRRTVVVERPAPVIVARPGSTVVVAPRGSTVVVDQRGTFDSIDYTGGTRDGSPAFFDAPTAVAPAPAAPAVLQRGPASPAAASVADQPKPNDDRRTRGVLRSAERREAGRKPDATPRPEIPVTIEPAVASQPMVQPALPRPGEAKPAANDRAGVDRAGRLDPVAIRPRRAGGDSGKSDQAPVTVSRRGGAVAPDRGTDPLAARPASAKPAPSVAAKPSQPWQYAPSKDLSTAVRPESKPSIDAAPTSALTAPAARRQAKSVESSLQPAPLIDPLATRPAERPASRSAFLEAGPRANTDQPGPVAAPRSRRSGVAGGAPSAPSQSAVPQFPAQPEPPAARFDLPSSKPAPSAPSLPAQPRQRTRDAASAEPRPSAMPPALTQPAPERRRERAAADPMVSRPAREPSRAFSGGGRPERSAAGPAPITRPQAEAKPSAPRPASAAPAKPAGPAFHGTGDRKGK